MIDYGKARHVKIRFGNRLEISFSKEDDRFVENVGIGFTTNKSYSVEEMKNLPFTTNEYRGEIFVTAIYEDGTTEKQFLFKIKKWKNISRRATA